MGEAFTQAREKSRYKRYDKVQNELLDTIEENSDIINGGAVNRRSASVYVCASVLLLAVVVSVFNVGIETVGIIIATIIPSGTVGLALWKGTNRALSPIP